VEIAGADPEILDDVWFLKIGGELEVVVLLLPLNIF
jgi:hypothetical protein